MSAAVSIGDSKGAVLEPHPLRTAVLGEVHARPVTAIVAPVRILHFAFDTTGERAAADRAQLTAFCTARGLATPQRGEKHLRVTLGATVLRWEQHSEFTTYTWEFPSEADMPPFHPSAESLAAPMRQVSQPGPVRILRNMMGSIGLRTERKRESPTTPMMLMSTIPNSGPIS